MFTDRPASRLTCGTSLSADRPFSKPTKDMVVPLVNWQRCLSAEGGHGCTTCQLTDMLLSWGRTWLYLLSTDRPASQLREDMVVPLVNWQTCFSAEGGHGCTTCQLIVLVPHPNQNMRIYTRNQIPSDELKIKVVNIVPGISWKRYQQLPVRSGMDR